MDARNRPNIIDRTNFGQGVDIYQWDPITPNKKILEQNFPDIETANLFIGSQYGVKL